MSEFVVVPYQNVGALGFVMSRAAAEAALGLPARSDTNRLGEIVLTFGSVIATFAEDELVEVALLPTSNPKVLGLAPFSDPKAFEELCKLDGNPKETLGFIVLLGLGITLTGFHDKDQSQLAMTAFSKGRWDALRPEMKDFA